MAKKVDGVEKKVDGVEVSVKGKHKFDRSVFDAKKEAKSAHSLDKKTGDPKNIASVVKRLKLIETYIGI